MTHVRKIVILERDVYSVVFTTLGAKSERKRRKSENNTMSNYPSVRKSRSPRTLSRVIFIALAGFQTFGWKGSQTLGHFFQIQTLDT